MANENGRGGVWPNPVDFDDQEVLWLIDMSADRFDRERTRRHPGHRVWSMPLVRGVDRISFYVRDHQAMGNLPTRIVAENSRATLFEFMENHRGALDLDFVTDSGHLAVRLQYWIINPPILLAVSGESATSACFRFQYFYRNREPVHTLTVVILDR